MKLSAFFAAFATLIAAAPVGATQFVYTYTGNSFDGGVSGSLTSSDSLDMTFTLSAPMPASTNKFHAPTATSVSVQAGSISETFNFPLSDPTDSAYFLFYTDASGNITDWTIQITNVPSSGVYETYTSGSFFSFYASAAGGDSVQISNQDYCVIACYISNPATYGSSTTGGVFSVASAQAPADVPEPASGAVFVAGLIALGCGLRLRGRADAWLASAVEAETGAQKIIRVGGFRWNCIARAGRRWLSNHNHGTSHQHIQRSSEFHTS